MQLKSSAVAKGCEACADVQKLALSSVLSTKKTSFDSGELCGSISEPQALMSIHYHLCGVHVAAMSTDYVLLERI